MRFLQFARGQDHLFILGDLFEYWLGDDAGIPMYHDFIAALKDLDTSGCAITVMHGNRDFLLGEEFAAASGATVVACDECRVQLNGKTALLMHGDTLCTEDTDYQHFRRKLREPLWQSQFLAKSVEARHEQAQALRAASADASQSKTSHIMDVCESAVKTRLEAHECSILIHGHTHRPARHILPDSAATRWVVGDWHSDHAQYVSWYGQKLELRTFR